MISLGTNLPSYLKSIIILTLTIGLGFFISKILENLKKRNDQYFFYKIIKDILDIYISKESNNSLEKLIKHTLRIARFQKNQQKKSIIYGFLIKKLIKSLF